MKTHPLRLIAIVIAIAAAAVGTLHARSLNEDAAVNLLLKTLQHDHAYAGRISLDCVTFITEEQTKAYFEIVLRENHTKDCGGDPETSPVVDRYRVHRSSQKIERFDPIEDKWQPYTSARIRR